jgi:hypothetical protein
MAKQVGPLFITGTIDGIIFYKLGEQYYLRSKGDYKSGKQMRKDPRLKRTMQKAAQFGGASKLVKEVYYRHLPIEVRKHGLFGKLTGRVNGWLQQGKSREEVKELLIAHCQSLVPEGLTAPITPVMYVAEPVTKVEVPSPAQAKAWPAVAAPVSASAIRTKKARYLSHWKVNKRGRLQIPKQGPQLGSITGMNRMEERMPDIGCKDVGFEPQITGFSKD